MVQNRSFFDVGPSQGAAYNLNNTGNATVLGGNHPVVGVAQFPGTLILRVNASPVPEPSTYAMMALGLAFLGLATRRKKLRDAAA